MRRPAMAQPKDSKVELFDPAELRDWQDDPRGKAFWNALMEMGNKRMSGIRSALRSGDQHDEATHLAGELEAIDEVRQLIDILIDEYRAEKEEEQSEKEKA